MGPVMEDGVDGLDNNVTDLRPLFPQALPELTDRVPLTKVAPMVMLMLLVPCPEFTVVPAGKVQV